MIFIVIKEYKNNNGAIIRFHDDCIKSKEEQEIIFQKISAHAQRYMIAKLVEEEIKKNSINEMKE